MRRQDIFKYVKPFYFISVAKLSSVVYCCSYCSLYQGKITAPNMNANPFQSSKSWIVYLLVFKVK